MREHESMRWAALLGIIAFAAPATEAAAAELAGPFGPAHLTLSGVRLPHGEAAPGANPFAIDGAGDVNGDGVEDVVVGSPGQDPLGRRNAGSAYVVFGGGGQGRIELGNFGPEDGFRIDGPPSKLPVEFDGTGPIGEALGTSVAGLGDVNGDGLADVAVGAPTSSAAYRALAGAVYVVFGKRDPAAVDVAAAGDWGYRVDGDQPFELLGSTAAGTGDVNGDGAGDLAAAGIGEERAYVVLGRAAPGVVDSRSLGADGYVLDASGLAGLDENESEGEEEVQLELAPAGDVDGDGRADTLVGVPEAFRRRGSAFAVFGGDGGRRVVLRRLGERGVRVDGGRSAGAFGTAVAGVGDMNGDGRDDFAVGDPEWIPGFDPRRDVERWPSPTGSAYVVLSPDGPGRILMEGAPGVVRLPGARPGDRAGSAVDGAGDVNGDGRPDILVGAPTRNLGCRSDTGAVYVVYGRGPGRVPLRRLERRAGFRLWGSLRFGQLGAPLRGMSDVTGDGSPEMLVGSAVVTGRNRHSPEAFVASPVRPSAAPPEAAPSTCLRVRVPRQHLRRVIRTGRLRVVIESRELGRVEVGVEDPTAREFESSFAAGRTIEFPRAAERTVRLRVSRAARRRWRERRRVRLILNAVHLNRSEDIRTADQLFVLR